MGRQVCGRLAGHCPDGPEGSRESGLPAVQIGGGEDAAVEMLAAEKTDETVRARTARRKALRKGHLPLMTARVSWRCRRHKPGVRSALRVCDRSVSVGNGVDDREVEGAVSRLSARPGLLRQQSGTERRGKLHRLDGQIFLLWSNGRSP